MCGELEQGMDMLLKYPYDIGIARAFGTNKVIHSSMMYTENLNILSHFYLAFSPLC